MPQPEALPLLSICIPTFNRSGFLRIMLQALLPQTELLSNEIEVWVLDNGSNDNTPEVVAELSYFPALKYYRHSTNIGPVKNIIFGPAYLAKGKYSWVLGDHNLLRPRMMSYVLDRLRQSPHPILHYTNFRCATYPDHWPDVAIGGFEGAYDYVADKELKDELLSNWNLLLKPETSIATQSYAHIVPTQIWRDFWKDREIGADYSDALTTYPHTTMLVRTSLNNEAITIKEPVITIFNNAQSWNNPDTKWNVYLRGLPNLLQILNEEGISNERVNNFRQRFLRPNLEQCVSQMIQARSTFHVVHRSLFEKNLTPETRIQALMYTLLLPIRGTLVLAAQNLWETCRLLSSTARRMCKNMIKKILK